MREKVLSTRTYRGYTIEHVEDEVFRANVPFHGSGYFKRRFWWIKELEWDEPRLRDAKTYIDGALAGSGEGEA